MPGSMMYGPWPATGGWTVKLVSVLRMRLIAGPSLLAGRTWIWYCAVPGGLVQVSVVPSEARGVLAAGPVSDGAASATDVSVYLFSPEPRVPSHTMFGAAVSIATTRP